MTLALKYRPQTFSDMVGQNVTAAVLNRMVLNQSVPSGLLFSGVKGSGKTTAARIVAKALGDLDVIEVDAASNGSVEAVRYLQDSLRYSSGAVVIYDEAHSMSKEAFNTLLKTLEEPPPGVYFILVTTEPEKILPTVQSRLIEFTFRKISRNEIFQRLSYVAEKEEIPASPELLALVSDRADGSMRDALMSLDQCWVSGIKDVDTYMELVGEADVAPDLLRALLTGDHGHIFEVTDYVSQRVPDPNRLAGILVTGIKELLVLRSGGTVQASDEGQRKRKELAQYLEPMRLIEAIKIIWDLKIKARAASDPRSNLDLALILVSEVFTRGRENTLRPTPVGVDTTKRVAFDDL